MKSSRLTELERDVMSASPMGDVPVPREELATLISAYRRRFTCSECSCNQGES